jgi:hypothetical protein
MQRLALSAIVGKEASKDAMLIVLEVASGPPWRAVLAPALILPIGSASSGGRWFRRGRRDQGGSRAPGEILGSTAVVMSSLGSVA